MKKSANNNEQKFYAPVFFFLLLLLLPLAQIFAQKRVQPDVVDKASAPSLYSIFRKYDLFTINTAEIKAQAEANKKGFSDFEFVFAGYPELNISIHENDILGENYQVIFGGDNGRQVQSRPDIMTYTGSIPGDGESRAYLTLGNNLISGVIIKNRKQYYIEPLRYYDRNANTAVYVVYQAEDVIPNSGLSCGLTEANKHLYTHNERTGDGNISSATGTCKVIEMAIASDYDMGLRYGFLETEQHNIAVMNLMPVFYDNAQLTWGWLTFRIAGQYIATSPAANASLPAYTGRDANTILSNFTNWGQANGFGAGFTFDDAQLWTTRDFGVESPAGSGNYSYGVIGLAWVNGTCTGNKYMILEDYSTSLMSLAGMTAHEAGHNLGSGHDATGGFVMSPSVENPVATTFSAASLSQISNYTTGAGGVCFSTCINNPPIAAFTPLNQSICVGNSITFTDVSAGTVTGRTWTFTGGSISTSTASSPGVAYTTAGMKSVKLVVTGPAGTSQVTRYFFVSPSATQVSRTSLASNNTFPVLYNFKLANLNHIGPQSVLVGGSYNDYSCTENTNLVTNTNYTVNYDIGIFNGSAYDTKLEVFIDYNRDGDFDDADEIVHLGTNCHSSPANSGSFTFTTPASVPFTNQFLRMRVVGINCLQAHTNGKAIYSNAMIQDYAVYFPDPCNVDATITGPTATCAVRASTQTFSIGATGGVSGYYWVLPPNTILENGQGSNTVAITFFPFFNGGNLSVYLKGCDGQNMVRTLTFTPGPVLSEISGASNLCSLSSPTATSTYSITPVASATYTWTVPSGGTIVSGQGTSSVQVNYASNFTSGTLQVSVTNSCGNSVKTLAITKSLATLVSLINGPADLCALPTGVSIANYSVDPLPGSLVYIWTAPISTGISSGQGTNNLALFIGSNFTSGTLNLSVSGCGTAATRSILIQGTKVTATAGNGGTITDAGVKYICPNADQTYTITPNACYSIANVVVDGVSQGAISSYTFNNVTSNHTISATFTLNSFTITATAGVNGSISPGTGPMVCGIDAVYDIIPDPCYAIENVIVDGVSQGAISSYTFTNVQAPHSISASFVLNTFTITATAGSNGIITAGGSVNCGSNAIFNITANPCYSIADVIVDGVSQGAISSYTFTNVQASHSISASFVLNTFTITSTSGSNGTISAGGSINCGSDATFNITANACYSIADVIVDGVSQGAISSYTFTNVQAAHSISASFTLNTHTITATAGSNGTITAGGSVNCGSDATFNITANACYSIADVIVDGVSQGAISSYTFTNVQAAHSISASFTLNTYAITATAGINGTITAGGSVNCGDDATYTITPNANYSIADVIVDGVSQGAIGTYTFSNVNSNHTISATFIINATFTITATAGANGSITPNAATVVNIGGSQLYTFTADPCFHVQDVLVDGVSVGAVGSYSFNNVTSNHTISVSFAQNGALTVAVSGPVNVCSYVGTGEPVTFTATSIGASGYSWVLPPNVNLVSGAGTANLTVTFAAAFATQPNKQIRVTATSPCGNSPLHIWYLAVQLPVTPQPIVAESNNICSVIGTAGTVRYTIRRVAYATSYNWAAQAGTTSIVHPNGPGINDTTILVSFDNAFTNSNITVAAVNSCGISNTRSIAVTRSAPSTPALISGPTNACAFMLPGGLTAVYTVPLVANATTYNWTLPAGVINTTGQGTNTVSFVYPSTFTSGSISVTANNGCGTSGTRSLAVTRLNPSTPGVVDVIQLESCPNRRYSYTLASMPGNATSVQWTIPAGATLESGQGTLSITVSYPATSVTGLVTAQAVNNCASSVVRQSPVKLPACPPVDKFAGKTMVKDERVVTLNVFPNPAIGEFKLQLFTINKERVQVLITDLQGRIVLRNTVAPNETVTMGQGLKAGTYLIQVTQGSVTRTQKLVRF